MGITLGLQLSWRWRKVVELEYAQAIDTQLVAAPDELKRAGEHDVRLLKACRSQVGPEDKTKLMESMRRALKESVAFFSSRNKGAIEQWAFSEVLRNLGVTFQSDEIIVTSPGQDPPDIIFRHDSFEVKEILDPGRRRHDEYKHALSKALATNDPIELFEYAGINDITPIEIANVILSELKGNLANKYEPRFRTSLNVLFYVDLVHRTLKTGPMPNPADFSNLGWRSVSVLIGWGALVYFADSYAPEFLRVKAGTVSERNF
jgi:hypothetical protein